MLDVLVRYTHHTGTGVHKHHVLDNLFKLTVTTILCSISCIDIDLDSIIPEGSF